MAGAFEKLRPLKNILTLNTLLILLLLLKKLIKIKEGNLHKFLL